MDCRQQISWFARCACRAVPTCLVLLAVAPVGAAEQTVFASHFSREAGPLAEVWRPSGNPLTPMNYQITEKNACDGVRALWISLAPSDPVRHRSELRLARPSSLEYDTDYEVSFDLCVPEVSPDIGEEVVVLQFHSWPDLDLGETWKSPHLRLGMVKGRWQLTSLADDRKVTPPKRHPADTRYRTQKVVDAGPVRADRWESWVFRVRFSPFADGRLEILRNGKVIAAWLGPNAFNDARGPFLKFGLYVPGHRPPQAVPGFGAHDRLFLAIGGLSIVRGSATVEPTSAGTGRP